MSEFHDIDRAFLQWVKVSLTRDLTAKHSNLIDMAWRPDLWKVYAIERELDRRKKMTNE